LCWRHVVVVSYGFLRQIYAVGNSEAFDEKIKIEGAILKSKGKRQECSQKKIG